MATVTVSNKSGLMKALNSADAGDRIVLKAGNYGELSLNASSRQNDYTFDDITIASESRSNPARLQQRPVRPASPTSPSTA